MSSEDPNSASNSESKKPSLSKKARAGKAVPTQIVKTSYTSAPVTIPDSFLSTASHIGPAVSYEKINFEKTGLPEYKGSYAVVLDNVLTASECDQLITMAQQSAGATEPGFSGWVPAVINAGIAGEFLATDYRNSDRIIWDSKAIVELLWGRCVLAPGLLEDLASIEGNEKMLGRNAVEKGIKWNFSRLNERMRFLRYGPGQFFKEHKDGIYQTDDGKERTFYTLHLYLNDSANEVADPSAKTDLVRGGATTFHSFDMERRLDVDPKAGRVLIFQHAGLLHSGDTVIEGTKYTMRTDLLFQLDQDVWRVETGLKGLGVR